MKCSKTFTLNVGPPPCTACDFSNTEWTSGWASLAGWVVNHTPADFDESPTFTIADSCGVDPFAVIGFTRQGAAWCDCEGAWNCSLAITGSKFLGTPDLVWGWIDVWVGNPLGVVDTWNFVAEPDGALAHNFAWVVPYSPGYKATGITITFQFVADLLNPEACFLNLSGTFS